MKRQLSLQSLEGRVMLAGDFCVSPAVADALVASGEAPTSSESQQSIPSDYAEYHTPEAVRYLELSDYRMRRHSTAYQVENPVHQIDDVLLIAERDQVRAIISDPRASSGYRVVDVFSTQVAGEKAVLRTRMLGTSGDRILMHVRHVNTFGTDWILARLTPEREIIELSRVSRYFGSNYVVPTNTGFWVGGNDTAESLRPGVIHSASDAGFWAGGNDASNWQRVFGFNTVDIELDVVPADAGLGARSPYVFDFVDAESEQLSESMPLRTIGFPTAIERFGDTVIVVDSNNQGIAPFVLLTDPESVQRLLSNGSIGNIRQIELSTNSVATFPLPPAIQHIDAIEQRDDGWSMTGIVVDDGQYGYGEIQLDEEFKLASADVRLTGELAELRIRQDVFGYHPEFTPTFNSSPLHVASRDRAEIVTYDLDDLPRHHELDLPGHQLGASSGLAVADDTVVALRIHDQEILDANAADDASVDLSAVTPEVTAHLLLKLDNQFQEADAISLGTLSMSNLTSMIAQDGTLTLQNDEQVSVIRVMDQTLLVEELAVQRTRPDNYVIPVEVVGLASETLVIDGAETRIIPFQPSANETMSVSVDQVFATDFDPADTNRDGRLTALDALLVVNYLNRDSKVGQDASPDPTHAEGENSSGADDDLVWADVNHDGTVSPLDVLLVVNRLSK